MAPLSKNLIRTTRFGCPGVVNLATGRFYPQIAGGAPVTVDELKARNADIRARLAEIDEEFRGVASTPDARTEWNTLQDERKSNNALIQELEARERQIREAAEEDGAVENGTAERGAEFHTARPGAARGNDIYDLTTIRSSVVDPQVAVRELRDRALRSLEAARFPVALGVDDDHCRSHVERLMQQHDSPEYDDSGQPINSVPGWLARHMLVTGSPVYKRAFNKYLNSKGLTADEQRALSVGTGSAGGFSIVYTLDPTIIPTSNLSVNPYREFANVETIAGTNEWRGVTSSGVTATRRAEAAATTDASPTLAQPSLVVSKVDCFIPVSIELTQDWVGIQSDLSALIIDAKDDEEAASFTTGTYGAGTSPGGLITGATTTVTAGGTAAFALADVYKLWEALPPRMRARAVWLANLFTYDKVRQFDTAGGAGIWVPNLTQGLTSQAGPNMHGSMEAQLLQKPAYESTTMAAALTTASKVLAVGDGRYFKIVDRIGMDIEVIPHLFGAAQGNLPTGQRGFYAYWRNTSKVLDPNGFRVLVTG
jgi:HK97 family phage major capsid protein